MDRSITRYTRARFLYERNAPLVALPAEGELVDYGVYCRPDAFDYVQEYVQFLVDGYAADGGATAGECAAASGA